MTARRIALAGTTGLLGSALTREMQTQCLDFVLVPRRLIEQMKSDDLARFFAAEKVDVVINCVASTNVERAEDEPAEDYRLNAYLPKTLAGVCAQEKIHFCHFSSTGCYGDWKSGPYIEDDVLRPQSKHHQAKAAGERFVQDSGARYSIFRLGWLYGGSKGHAKNFVWQRLLEAEQRPEMTSDSVQRGCPTHVDDVAKQVLAVLKLWHEGIFNAVAHGDASRYEYVKAIVETSRAACTVSPGPAFKRLAPVSRNETAVNKRLADLELDMMPAWLPALQAYVRSLIG